VALDNLASGSWRMRHWIQEQVFATFEAADGGMPRHGFSEDPGERPAPVPEPALSIVTRRDGEERRPRSALGNDRLAR